MDTSLVASIGFDQIELTVIGKWQPQSLRRLLPLELGEQELAGQPVIVANGGDHGPEFYPITIRRMGKFRIDPFRTSYRSYAARIILYPKYFGPFNSASVLKPIRDFTAAIGLIWESELLSRIDVRADVALPFDEFRWRIDERHWICPAGRSRKLEKKNYATTRYIGNSKGILLRIYDKAVERESKGIAADGPLTRIEFQIRRQWLRRKGIDEWSDDWAAELWPTLTTWFRMTDRKADTKHQQRCKTWPVWATIQNAWPQLPLLSRESARPLRRLGRI